MVARALRAAVFLSAVGGYVVAARGQSLTASDLIVRLGAAVDAWERDLGSVVADELYRQTVVRTPRSGSIRGVSGPLRQTRELLSEFTLVHFDDGGSAWIGVRQVQRVDNQPVATIGPSLHAVLTDPRLTWSERWRRIRESSAAYNLGSVTRDVNVPTFALAALRTANHRRFNYSAPRQTTIDGRAVTALEFSERSTPTLVSGTSGQDLPLRGKVWVDSHDGHVVRTEIQLRDRIRVVVGVDGEQDQEVASLISVNFVSNASVGTWVPVEMRERYDHSLGEVTTGEATYSNYRRFRTEVRLVRPQ